MIVDIKDIDKAVLLTALFNRGKVQGGLHTKHNRLMNAEEAQALINSRGYDFDYIHGRVMKIDISSDTVNSALYDRNNGDGTCSDVVRRSRNKLLSFNLISTPSNEFEETAKESGIVTHSITEISEKGYSR